MLYNTASLALLALSLAPAGLSNPLPLPLPLAARALQHRATPSTSSSAPTASESAASPTFASCSTNSVINAVTISPCEPSDIGGACTFVNGRDYTVEVDFTPHVSSEQPRSGIRALDDVEDYAYPGQTFDACAYTACPIMPEASRYVVTLGTYDSPLDGVNINITDGVFGQSIFCVTFPVHYLNSTS